MNKIILFSTLIILAIALNVSASDNTTKSDSTNVDSLSTRKNNLAVLPFAFYSPQTKFAFGVLPTYIYYTSDRSRPSSISTPAYYTTQKQFSGAIKPEYYSGDNRYLVSSEIVFLKWPALFYGIGSNTSKDDEEEYTINMYGVSITAQREFYNGFYLGVNYDFRYTEFSELEIGGALESSTITGAVNNNISGLGLSSRYDTRDMIFFPGKGSYHQFNMNFYGKYLGGDFTYTRYTIDLRRYFTIKEIHYFAVQTRGDFVDGNPPFTVLPLVGNVIRGYYPTRYTDKNLIAIQAEYRIVPLWKRLGIVFFAGTGGVSSKISNFKSDDFKFAFGLGTRYVFIKEEKLNLSIDMGFGKSGAEIYMTIAEAF